ncbi:MAG: hypothetical protein ACKOPM_13810 [Novosphingobium sp.]
MVRKNSRTSLRQLALCLAIVTLTGCGSGARDVTGNREIPITDAAMRTRIVALAACPSPLDRLGIGRIAPRVAAATPGSATIRIPAAADAEGSTIRFDLKSSGGGFAGQLQVRWTIRISDTAQELDLGEDRLLNPARFGKEIDEAITAFTNYYYEVGQPDQSYARDKRVLNKACRKFGRLLDAVAISTNPGLRTTVERQKHRDALGWLFTDNYRLKTESPDGAYWEAEPDYGGFYEN